MAVNLKQSDSVNLADCDGIKKYLPPGFEYRFVESQDNHCTTIRVNLTDAEKADQWKNDLEENCKVTWRLTAGQRAKGKLNVYKRYFRCQHNTHPRSLTADDRSGSKNSSCPALLTITIKRTDFSRKSRAKTVDEYLPDFPGIIKFTNDHNHQVFSSDSLRERDVSEETEKKLRDLFANGHSPSSAVEAIKMDLQIAAGDNYVFAAADRANCPDLGYCFRLYYKIFQKAYGAVSGEQMLKDLQYHAERFNEENGEDCVKMRTIDKDFVVAICTPVMKRVHRLIEQSGELVFVDASGGVDRHHCRIFLLLTHSAAGGLPLGCIITTSETKDVIAAGLGLFKELLPSDAFYGRGLEGPQVFMTDDSLSERNAIHECFQNASLLLCVFHVLQANWRYLWDAKHGIRKEDRPHLLGLFKAMVYSVSKEELDDKYAEARDDQVAKKYENYLAYLEDIFERQGEWAICLRQELPTRGNNTNNFVESAMRVLKDKVFLRVKAFNVVQLLDFILTRFESYYVRRLIDIANNRLDMRLSHRFLPVYQNKLGKDMVKPICNSLYTVNSETKPGVVYHVDMSIGLCTCFIGNTGSPCKHQYAIVKHYSVESVNFVPVHSPVLRGRLYQIATGCTNVPDGWFASLRSSPPAASHPSTVEAPMSADPNSEEMDIVDEATSEPVQQPGLESLHQQRELQNRFLGRQVTSTPMNTSQPGNHDAEISEDIKKVHIQIKEAAEDICQRLQKNPSLLVSAKKFVKKSGELVNDSALDSALACFGRYTGAGLSKCTKSKGKVMQHGSKIGVQPTAIARRKSALGGRKCLVTGRKTKGTLCPMKENNYEYVRSVIPKKRPRKAPHSLVRCVESNQSLGKTHSTK